MRATSCTALFAHSRAISGDAIGDFPTYVVEHFLLATLFVNSGVVDGIVPCLRP